MESVVRVMLVTHRFPPDDLGGVEQYTQSLAAELMQRGDSVSIVTRRTAQETPNRPVLREQLPDGAPLFRLFARGNKPERVLDGHDELLRLFTMTLLEVAPEVVHFNHLAGFPLQVISLAHRLGAAVIVSLHDFYFACPRVHLQKPTGELCNGPQFGRECAATCFSTEGVGDRQYWGLRAMYFQRALGIADHAIAYSQYVARYFEPIRGTAIEVIDNGVLPGCVRSDGPSQPLETSQVLTLAYCGTVAPHKGPHLLLEAVRMANLNRIRVRMIGHAPDRAYAARLREKAAAIPGLNLQIFGKFSRTELPLLLGDVDCVVVPSLVPEAGPIAPREALACGVPVLASRLGALPELIREGENGFTFDSARPADLAAILRRLAHSSELLPRLREGARRSAVTSLADHATRVRAAYGTAIERFRNRPADSIPEQEFDFLHDALAQRERERRPDRHQQISPVCATQAGAK